MRAGSGGCHRSHDARFVALFVLISMHMGCHYIDIEYSSSSLKSGSDECFNSFLLPFIFNLFLSFTWFFRLIDPSSLCFLLFYLFLGSFYFSWSFPLLRCCREQLV